MLDETRKRIDSFFEEQRRSEERAKAAIEARIAKEEGNLVRFLAIADNVIRPCFEEMAAYITSQGIRADVLQKRPKPEENTAVHTHSIEILFPQSVKAGATEIPYFKLSYNKVEDILTLYMRTNEYNLPGQRHAPETITREWLEDQFSHYFTKGI